MKLDYEKELYLEPFFEIVYFEVLNVLEASWEGGINAGDKGDKDDGWGDIPGLL